MRGEKLPFSKRRPYLLLKLSLKDFFTAPIRLLKETIEKESEFEKPYLMDESSPREMHLAVPIPEIGLPPWTPPELPCPPEESLMWDIDRVVETLGRSTSTQLYILGGVSDFVWTISDEGGFGFFFDPELTQKQIITTEREVTLYTSAAACGHCLIEVVDFCGEATAGGIRSTFGSWQEACNTGLFPIYPDEDVFGCCWHPGRGNFISQVSNSWFYDIIFGYGRWKQWQQTYRSGTCQVDAGKDTCEWVDGADCFPGGGTGLNCWLWGQDTNDNCIDPELDPPQPSDELHEIYCYIPEAKRVWCFVVYRVILYFWDCVP